MTTATITEPATERRQYTIRAYRAGTSDQATIRRVFADTHRPEFALLPSHLEQDYRIAVAGELGTSLTDIGRYYAAPPNRFFVASAVDDPDDIAGCCALVHIDDSMCEIKNVVVHPNRQGLGIARLLMDAFERGAREGGYTKAVLWTYENLRVALGMYQRRGWVERYDFEVTSDMIVELGPIFMELDIPQCDDD